MQRKWFMEQFCWSVLEILAEMEVFFLFYFNTNSMFEGPWIARE